MNKTLMMLTVAVASVAGASFAADAENNLRDAAKAAGEAATQKSAELNASAKVSSEEMKADAEGAAAVSATGVVDTVKHRAKQTTHKVKKASAEAKEKYHGAMADHYEKKAAADISASMSVGH